MKAAILVGLAFAAGTARAEYVAAPPEDPSGDPPVKLGTRFSIGRTAYEDSSRTEMSIGLDVEHPVFRHTRVLAEYEWMWLLGGDMQHPERVADGQRIQVGLRTELGHRGKRAIRFFADGELGAGVALLNDSMTGFAATPTGFAGLRGGYSLAAGNRRSPSVHFEAEVSLRIVVLPEGAGGLVGVGMLWD